MIVRHPTSGEVDRAGEIAHIAFQHSGLEYWQAKFRRHADRFGVEYVLVVETEGQLVSSLICTPGPISCGGDTVTHSAVGAVGTIPEFRNRGCAGFMMAETVRYLRRIGHHTSSLWPFSYPYYRKFGWEVGAERRKYSGKPEAFKVIGNGSKVRNAYPDDLPAIRRAFEHLARRYSCFTVRDETWWNGLLREADIVLDGSPAQPDGRRRIACIGDGDLKGYASYAVSTKDDEKNLHVDEIAAETPSAAAALIARIAEEPVDTMSIHAPSDDLLLQQLDDPRSIESRLEPGHQFRAIDPPSALASRTGQPGVSGRLEFELTDPVFTEGWRFIAEIDDGRISVSKDATRDRFSTTVEMFARMFSGYSRPSQVLALGRGSVTSERALTTAEALFRPSVPFRTWLEPG